MPLNPINFQVLSPQQADPFVYGLGQGAQIGNSFLAARAQAIKNQMAQAQLPYAQQLAKLGLQKQQIANSTAQNTLNYAPQMSQAQLASAQTMPGLYGSEAAKNQAQTAYLGQQASLYPYQVAARLGPLTQLLAGQQFMGNIRGNGVSPSNGGMTLSVGGATPTVPAQSAANYQTLPGGLSAPQGQQVAAQLPMMAPGAPQAGSPGLYDTVYQNAIRQLGKDPTQGSAKGGAGGTYFNPLTGQTTSSDTTANTTLDQQTSAAIQRVSPLLDQLSSKLAPFQTAKGYAGLRLGQALNFSGLGKSQTPNDYAIGQEALKVAPESLIRSFGLRVTNEALQRMEDAVKPVFGETPDAYKARITNTLAQLQENQTQAQGRLRSGMNVDQPPADYQTQKQQLTTSSTPMTKTVGGKTYTKINGRWFAQ